LKARSRRLVLLVAALCAALFAVPAMANSGKDNVYTLTNSAAGNSVLVFDRDADGSLTAAGSVASGGLGSGLGSQGAVILDDHAHRLFAVNAGSDTVSSFAVTKDGLELVDTAPSGGDLPISLTYDHGVLYVLDAGAPNSISGLRVDHDGDLSTLAGSTRPLSAPQTGPAQVQFSPHGDVLVVTEKATNRITTFVVDKDGLAGAPAWFPSAGGTPFGFAFAKHDRIVVSDAAPPSGASSYQVNEDGTVSTITGVAATGQPSACWTVVTKNGRYAYTANTGAGSISGYEIGHDGSLTVLDGGIAATTGGSPGDSAITGNGRFLYVRNGIGAINAFRIGHDGSLTALAGIAGLPAGTVGLAAG
jgi:6-phosphogluconolactonase